MKFLNILSKTVFFSLIICSLASCGNQQNEKSDSSNMESESSQMTSQNKHVKKKSITVKISQKKPFGEYLTDENGNSLYLFLNDSNGKSKCYDQCANMWPPLMAKKLNIEAGPNIDSAKIDKIKRKNGAYQITYFGHPLYYYSADQKSGEVKGQDLKQFGAEWYLIKPNGKKMGDVEEK